MKISIVTTLYYSEPYVKEFYERSIRAVKTITDDFEIIFVNDGSPDNSLREAVELTKVDANVMVVDLSRNFGHHKAMMEGLSHTTGDYIFLIDSDLEEAPELLRDFYETMCKVNSDVVYGIQKIRKGGFWEKITGEIFFLLFNYLSGLDMPKNLVTARLMSRRYVDKLVQFREHELLIAGLWHITGFVQVPFEIKKLSSSKTSYKVNNKISNLVNAITSFSNKPLLLIFYFGLVVTVGSFMYSTYLVLRVFLLNHFLEGWTSVIVSIWFLGGLIILFIGIVGIYLSKIFIETKNRPYTIIRDIYGGKQ